MIFWHALGIPLMVSEQHCHISFKHFIRLYVSKTVQDLLVNGLEKLALVFPHLGMIYLLDQLGVFVD